MASYKSFYKAFATPPLSAQSLAAGNWTIYIGSQADSGNVFYARFYCYVLRSGSNVATIFAPNSETVASSITSYVGRIHVIAGSSATILAGDKIVIEVWSVGSTWSEGTYARLAFNGVTEVDDESATNTTPASKVITPQLLHLLLTPTGIATAGAFGTQKITQTLHGTGIATAGAFGTAVLTVDTPWYFSGTQDSTGYTEKSTDPADEISDISSVLLKLSSQKGSSVAVATASEPI